MEEIWKKYKEIVVLFAYMALLAAMYIFVVKPLFLAIEEKKNYSEKMAVDQEIAQKKINDIPEIKEKMEAVNRMREELDVFFNQENALSLIERLESLSVETGNDITIEIIAENGSQTKSDVKKIKGKETVGVVADLPGENFLMMRLSLVGGFDSTLDFMRRLENMNYFSDVISLKMSSYDKSSSISSSGSVGAIFGGDTVGKTEEAEYSNVDKYENPLRVVLEVVFYQE